MPQIIDYDRVTQQMLGQGLECLYYNSGAFGFPPGVPTYHVGWVGPPDDSVRPAARALARPVPPPYEANLAALTRKAWRECLPGPLWVMPKSHWAYELDFGSRRWMPDALRALGLDPADLETRTDGSAIEFVADAGTGAYDDPKGDEDRFQSFAGQLLSRLLGSDFLLAWPGRPVVCTLHHHKQIWWTSTDESLIAALDRLGARLP